jgi:hypothetical protein
MTPALAAIAASVGLVGTLLGAFVSFRLVKPRQQQIVAQAQRDLAASKNEASQAADRLIGRYAEIVNRQDSQLSECHSQLAECHRRIDRLERLLVEHGVPVPAI